MTEKNKKVPQLRFPEFTDDWEQRKLAKLCEKFTDGDWIESKDQSNFGVRLVQTGNVGVAEYLDKPNNQKWISTETFDRLHCEEVLPGDILISRLPEPAGRACIMPKLGTKMITAVDCTIVRTASDCSNEYLVQFLSSQDYFKEVNTALAGGTRQRISRSNLASIDVPTPPTFEEQEAIGAFFGNLDSLITLHQRKLDHLQLKKKALLQKLFPKEGEKVPEIRLPGFKGEWEKKKLKEIFEITRGKVLATSKINESNTNGLLYPVYSSQTKDEGLMGYYPDYLFDEGITWTTDGANAGTVRFRDSKFYCTNVCGVLLSERGYANLAVAEALNLVAYKHVSKVGNPKLMNNVMAEIELSLPSSCEELIEISKIFESLNRIISLHQRKLDHLREQKKTLLQQMFV